MKLVSDVLKESHFIDADWFELGMGLNLPYPGLASIRARFTDPSQCLLECLSLWLTSANNCTWESLASALERMNQKPAATLIRNTYHLHNTTRSGASAEVFHMFQAVHQYPFDTMRGKFGIFRFKILQIVVEQVSPIFTFLIFLRQCFPELDSQLSTADTVQNAMTIVLTKCNIISISAVENIASFYNIAEAKQLIVEYKEEVNEFCSKIPLDFLLNKRLSTDVNSLKCETVQFVLDWTPDQHSLDDIRLLLQKAFTDLNKRLIVKVICPDDPVPADSNLSNIFSAPISLGTAEEDEDQVILLQERVENKVEEDKELHEKEKQFYKQVIKEYEELMSENELTHKQLKEFEKNLKEEKKTSSSLMKQKEVDLKEKEKLQKKIDNLQQKLELQQVKDHKEASDHPITQSELQSEIQKIKSESETFQKQRKALILENERLMSLIKDHNVPVEQKEETEILQETETVHTCTYISKGHIIILIYTVFLFFIIYTSYERDSFIAPLPGVEVTRSTNVIIPGGISKTIHLKEFGLVIVSPPDIIPAGFFAVINIRLSVTGPYVYPDPDNHTMVAASPVYWLSSSKEFLKPLELGIRHYASEKAAINVYTANESQTNMSYIFRKVANVTVSKNYAYFSMNHFSGIAVLSNDTTFCGTLYFQKSHTIEFQWDYNFVMYKCWSGHNFAKNWSVEIDNTIIEFEENSTKIELDIKSNPSKNWKAVAKRTPLLYTLQNLLNGNVVTSNMQFSLQWNGNDSLPTSENLVFFLKGALEPKEITVTTQSISFWKQYKESIILCIIIVIIISMLIIGKYFTDYQKGTIGTILSLLKFVLIGLVIYLLSHFVPEIISNPLMALWTKLVGSP